MTLQVPVLTLGHICKSSSQKLLGCAVSASRGGSSGFTLSLCFVLVCSVYEVFHMIKEFSCELESLLSHQAFPFCGVYTLEQL